MAADAHHQRRASCVVRRPLGDLARPGARTARPDRFQKGLRSRPVRRLHDAGRRPAREQLPAARDDEGRRTGHDRRRAEGRGRALHPLQEAFMQHDAFQCGYCTPGQLCSAVGLLAEGRATTRAEIRELMSGNLCRCGAYVHIVDAIEDVLTKQRSAPHEPLRLSPRGQRRSSVAVAGQRRGCACDRGRHESGRSDEVRGRAAGRVDRHHAAATVGDRGSRRRPGQAASYASARWSAIRRSRTTSASSRAIRCSAARSWPAPPRSCATRRAPAAICCSARVATTSTTSPRRATSARRGRGAVRSAG